MLLTLLLWGGSIVEQQPAPARLQLYSLAHGKLPSWLMAGRVHSLDLFGLVTSAYRPVNEPAVAQTAV